MGDGEWGMGDGLLWIVGERGGFAVAASLLLFLNL